LGCFEDRGYLGDSQKYPCNLSTALFFFVTKPFCAFAHNIVYFGSFLDYVLGFFKLYHGSAPVVVETFLVWNVATSNELVIEIEAMHGQQNPWNKVQWKIKLVESLIEERLKTNQTRKEKIIEDMLLCIQIQSQKSIFIKFTSLSSRVDV